MNKTVNQGRSSGTFDQGAALSPADKLVEWLDGQQVRGEPRLVRLPIVLDNREGSYNISKAHIGGAPDALEIYANDSALGDGLADRAEYDCPDGPTCAFRVEGYWRGKQNGRYRFDVNKAEILDAAALAAVTHAEVEGESGN